LVHSFQLRAFAKVLFATCKATTAVRIYQKLDEEMLSQIDKDGGDVNTEMARQLEIVRQPLWQMLDTRLRTSFSLPIAPYSIKELRLVT